jgi:hypothetical protein
VAAAGVAYVAAWAAGLAAWPANPDVTSSGAAILAAYGGHRGAAMAQSLLVHGVAGVLLAVVVVALARTARRHGERARATVVLAGGLAAVVLSLVQFVLGELLAGWAVPAHDAGAALLLFDLVQRLDGLKMLALAVLAAGGADLALRGSVLPRWHGWLAVLLGTALLVSGAGYLLLESTLATAAFVSGPLLLLWVAATGVVLRNR